MNGIKCEFPNISWIRAGICLALLTLMIFLAQSAAIYINVSKTNNVSKFNLTPDKISKDLDGKTVAMMGNQIWPFDLSQNIGVTVVGKKQLDEYVVVVADVKALAAVQQEEKSREQFSTNPAAKDAPKPKLPSKVALSGRLKMTYELIEGEWYLLSIDNLNLHAMPID